MRGGYVHEAYEAKMFFFVFTEYITPTSFLYIYILLKHDVSGMV
jgi:hypothetical protein